MSLLQRRPTVSQAALGVFQAGQEKVTLLLYSALVRPHLEFWTSQYQADMDIME